MKQLLTIFLSIICFAWSGCADHSSTVQAVNLGSTQPASPVVEKTPLVPVQDQQQEQAEPHEQSSFGAEEEIKNPSGVPEDVLQILQRDERNRTCLAANEAPESIPSSWFVASEINLNNDGLKDLVVTAVNPCLFGANINPFWIFRGTPQGQELVLSLSTLNLEVLDAKTKNHRDILAIAATSKEVLTTVYRFDGGRYRKRHSSREPITE
jgi:hypothetical protein